MPVFKCQSCQSRMSAREELIGRKVACPRCGEQQLVPEVAEVARPVKMPPPADPRRPPAISPGFRTWLILFGYMVGLGFLGGGCLALHGSTLRENRTDSEGLFLAGVVTIILAVAILAVCAVQPTELAYRLRHAGALTGLSKEEVIALIGKPRSWSAVGPGRELLQWIQPGFHIALVFQDGICEGVTHEFTA